MTRPCTAIRRHGGKVIGKGDVDLTSMNLKKHAEIAYPVRLDRSTLRAEALRSS